MPESDISRGNQLIAAIHALNQSIDAAMSSAQQLQAADIEEISFLCEQRTALFGALKEWRNSTDGTLYVATNNAAWQEAIDALETGDARRTEMLKEKISAAAAHLRSTMQHKSVLLYHTSGGYHG